MYVTTLNYPVAQAPVSAELTQPAIHTFDNTAYKPTVKVMSGENTLEEGDAKDYTVAYAPVDASGDASCKAEGDYKATVTLNSGNYQRKTIDLYYTIGDRKRATITRTDSGDFTYNGADQKPTISVTVDGTALTEGANKDYTITYATADTDGKTINAGDYTATVEIINPVYGADAVVFNYTIKPAIVPVKWTGLTTTYTGSEQAPMAKITGVGSDGEIDLAVEVGGAEKQTNVGSYVAVADFASNNTKKGNYVLTGTDATFTINKEVLSIVWTVNEAGYPYGSTTAFGPTAVVKAGTTPLTQVTDAAATLKEGEFRIKYDANKNAGEGKIARVEFATGISSNFELDPNSALLQKYKINPIELTAALKVTGSKEYSGGTDAADIVEIDTTQGDQGCTGYGTVDGRTDKWADAHVVIASAAFDTPDVGDNKDINVNLIVSGPKKDNYFVTTPVTLKGTIVGKKTELTKKYEYQYNGTAQEPKVLDINGNPLDASAYRIEWGSPAPTNEDKTNASSNVFSFTIIDNDDTDTIAFDPTPATFQIVKRAVTITPDDANKVYGGTEPTQFTYKTNPADDEGLIPTDVTALKLKLSRAQAGTPDGENVGDYEISVVSECDTQIKPYTNYQLTLKTGTFTIKPAPLNITVTSDNKVYGAAEPTEWKFTVGGNELVNNDTIDTIKADITVARKGVGTADPDRYDPAGKYDIIATIADQLTTNLKNYEIKSNTNGVFEITKALLTITWSEDATKTYTYTKQAQGPVPTITGLLSDADKAKVEVKVDGAKVADATTADLTTDVQKTDAGTYTITIVPDEDILNNYAITGDLSRTFTINPIMLTVTADDKEIDYPTVIPDLTFTKTLPTGDIPDTLTAVVVGNLLTSAGTVGTVPVSAGSFDIFNGNLKIADDYANNYELVEVIPGTLTVAAATATGVTVTFVNPPDETYDAKPHTPAVVVKAKDAQQQEYTVPATSYKVEYINNVNAGWATVRVSDVPNSNIIGTPVDLQFWIEPLAAELEWNPATAEYEYDGRPKTATATVKNLQTSVDNVKDTCTVTVVGERTDAGTFKASATELSNPNYKLPAVPENELDITIKPAPLTIYLNRTKDADTALFGKIYRNDDPADLATAFTVDGLMATDKIEGIVVTREMGADPKLDKVGAYAVKVADANAIKITHTANGVNAKDNYDISYVTADFTISQRPVTARVDLIEASQPFNGENQYPATIKVYDKDETDGVYLIGELTAPATECDEFKYRFADAHKDAKTYTLTFENKSTGNYNIQGFEGETEFTITALALQFTWQDTEQVYNNTPLNPTPVATNLPANENMPDLLYKYEKVKEDGTTEPVTNAIDAGKYKVTVSVNSGFPNYNVLSTEPSATMDFTINQRVLNVTPVAGKTKIYGDEDPQMVVTDFYTVDNFATNHDFVSVFEDSADDHAVIGRTPDKEDAGEYDYTIGNLKSKLKSTVANNYDIAIVANAPKFTIERKDLTLVPGDNVTLDSTWTWNETSWESPYTNAVHYPVITITDATAKTVPVTVPNTEYKVDYNNQYPLKANDYTFSISDVADKNYNIIVPDGTVFAYSIKKKVVAIAWSNTELTYNGLDDGQAPTATITIPDAGTAFDGVVLEAIIDGKQKNSNVGAGKPAYTATVTGLKLAQGSAGTADILGNLALPNDTTVSTSFNINPKSVWLTGITVKDGGKVYDGKLTAILDFSGVEFHRDDGDGLYPGDTLKVAGKDDGTDGSYATAGANKDPKQVTINYANLKLVGDGVNDPTPYNYRIDPNAQDAQKHTAGIISQKDLTVNPVVAELAKDYLDDEPEMVITTYYTLEGFAEGDTAESVPVTGNLGRKGVGDAQAAVTDPVGEYDITLGTIDVGANYNPVLTPAKFSIKPRPVTPVITIIPNTTIYNSEEQTEANGNIEVIVKDDKGNVIALDSGEYELSYANNILVGTATVTVKDALAEEPNPVDRTKSGNYTLTQADATFTIDKATLIMLLKDKTKVYDEDDPDLGTIITLDGFGLQGNDAFDKNTKVIRVEGEHAGDYELSVDAFKILRGGVDVTGCYDYELPTATFTITRRPVEVVLADVTLDKTEYTYSGQYNEPTVTVVDSTKNNKVIDPSQYKVAYIDNVNRGTGKVLLSDNNKYDFANGIYNDYDLFFNLPEHPAFEIKPLEAKLKWNGSDTYVYDGKVHGPTAEVTNLVTRYNGKKDKCDVIVVGKHSDAGTYVAAAASLSSGNYVLPEDSEFDYAITPLEVTVSGITAKDKVYDGTTAAELDTSKAQFKGMLATDKLNVSGTGTFADANVGKDKKVTISNLVLDGKGADNYVLADKQQTETKASITKATLSVHSQDHLKKYGESDPELKWVAYGFQGKDTASIVTGKLDREPGENVGWYETKVGTLKAEPNYEIEFVPAHLVIASRTVKDAKVVVDPEKTVYNGKAQTLDVAVYDDKGVLIDPDEYVAVYTDNINVGTATVTIIDVVDGNYTVLGTGTFEIVPATLTVVANDQSKLYRDPDPTLTYTVEGLQGNDTEAVVLTGELAREPGEDRGVYPINQGTLKSNSNYELTFVGANLTINARPVTVYNASVKLQKERYTYDRTAKEPKAVVTVDGVEIPESEYVLSYANNVNAGTALAFLADSSDSNNYDLTFPESPIKFYIDPKEIGLSWKKAAYTYDKKRHIPKATATGLIDDDKCRVSVAVNGNPVDAGTYTVYATDLSNHNYKLPKDNKFDFVIKPVQLTVTAQAKSKIALTPDPKFTYKVKGLLKGDKMTGKLTRVAGELPGKYKIKLGTLTAGSNYTIKFVSAKLTIKTIVANDPVIKVKPAKYYYDGKAKKPKVTVKYNGKIVPASEYTVKYLNNVEIGTATVVVKDKKGGYYKVNGTATFEIVHGPVKGTLMATANYQGKNQIVLSWNKLKYVDGYDLYLSLCNNNGVVYEPKKFETITGNDQQSYTIKDLMVNTCYKMYVCAWIIKDGKKQIVRSSPMVHCITAGSTTRFTMPAELKVNGDDSLKLAVGETYKITGSVSKENRKLKLLDHTADLQFLSSDKKVASVESDGTVTAKKAGTCKIYVFTINGLYTSIKVTVK